jgi:hypothetical protein
MLILYYLMIVKEDSMTLLALFDEIQVVFDEEVFE